MMPVVPWRSGLSRMARSASTSRPFAARGRLFETSHNRENDAQDGLSIAAVALRTKELRVLRVDGKSRRCDC